MAVLEEGSIQGLKGWDLLRIPHFRQAKILAGERGLERDITRVNVMEVPDVIHWVRSGEFLMTTGYPYRKKPEALAELIPQLAEKGVSVFGIKTKRFIDTVPTAALEAAELHGLPLIELPPDTAFSDVVREVMERVLVAESRHLTLLQHRVQRLSQVLLHGGELPLFLDHLERLTGNPVLLLGPHGERIASPSAEELWESAAAGSSPDLARRMREDAALGLSVIRVEDRDIRVYISTVPDRRPVSALLLLLEWKQDYGLVDTLTMNWAAELAAFEIRNAQVRRDIESKYIDQFIQDWLAGRIPVLGDLKLRAETCGYPFKENTAYRAGIVRFHHGKLEGAKLQDAVRRLRWHEGAKPELEVKWAVMEGELAALAVYAAGCGSGGMAGTRSAGTVTPHLPQPEAGDNAARPDDGSAAAAASVHQVEEAITELIKRVLPELPATVCFGGMVQDHGGVPESYRQAKRSAEVSRVCGMDRNVVRYEELGVYLLLYRMPQSEELEAFKRAFLEPLLEYDRSHQASLLQTLRVYFSCGGNIRETSDRMFVHYNTVAYRLDRVRNELGLPLDEPEVRLQLQLAVKLSDIG